MNLQKTLRMVFPILISFFLFLITIITINSVNAITYLDNCTNITTPGYYELNTSIIDKNISACITINNDSIYLDGKNYNLDGIDRAGSYGIKIIAPASSNITILNFLISDWYYGAAIESDIDPVFIVDSNFSSNYYGTINSKVIPNSNIAFNYYYDNEVSMWFFGNSTNGTFNDNIIINASSKSLYVQNTENTRFVNNFINGSSYDISVINFNNWNISLVNATNIIGGSLMGGNYWGKSDGTGFSDVCHDSDNNGICNAYFQINALNIDYYPLSYGYNESEYDILLEDIIQSDYDDCEDCRHLTLYYYEERNDITSLLDLKSCLESWPGWSFENGIDSYFGNYIKTDTYGCGAQRYIEEECDEKSMYITNDYIIWRMDLNHSWAFVEFIDGAYSHENLVRQVRTISRSGCGIKLNYMGLNSSTAIGWIDTAYLSGAYQNWESGGEQDTGTFNYLNNNYQWNGFRTWHTSGDTQYLINDNLIWYNNVEYICNNEIEYSESYSSTVESYISVGNNTLTLLDNACFDFHNVYILQIENNYRSRRIIYPDVDDNNFWSNALDLGKIIYLYSLPLGISSGFNIMIYKPIWNEDYYSNVNIPVHIVAYNEDNNLTHVEYFANDNVSFFRNTTNEYCENCTLTDIFEINISRDGFVIGNNQKLTIVAYNHTSNISKDVYFNILEFTNLRPTIIINTPTEQDYEENDITLNFIATDLDGTIEEILIWMDGSIYKNIENINSPFYNYTESFVFDDNPHDFFIEVWDNNKGWNFDGVDFTTGMITDFNILSPFYFETYNIEDNLTITYEITKHPYFLNYMEFYINDILINNISGQFYYTFNYTIDTNFTIGINNLKFRCYYGDSNNYNEKVMNVIINSYFQIQVLNGLTFEPVNNVKLDFYEYDTTFPTIRYYIETRYTNSNGIATFYHEPNIYLFTMTKIGYENKQIEINENAFGLLYQTILEPITTDISVNINFIIQNSTNDIILSQIKLTDLVTPSNTYTFYSNTSEIVSAGTYSIIVSPIENNFWIYKTYYLNLDISQNLTYTITLENIGTSNKISVQTLDSEDSSLISNIMIHVRKDDVFIQSIYKSSLEPLILYLENGNYTFGGSKDDYRLVNLVNLNISSDTNINIFFIQIDESDYITLNIGVYDTTNLLINNTVTYSLYDIDFSEFIETLSFSGGDTSISILKNVNYKLILSSIGFQTKEIQFIENIDSYYKIIMYRTGEIEPPELDEDDVYVSGGRLLFNRVYDFVNIITGGGLVLGLVLMLITLWTLNSGEQKTPERTQLSYLLIEALGFTLLGLFPSYFGILIIIIIGTFLSKEVYPKMEGNG